MKRNYLTYSQYYAILAIIGDKHKCKSSLRDIFDTLLYLLKTGCQWCMLPSDFPKWRLVHCYFQKWSHNGTLEEINDMLRDRLREKRGELIDKVKDTFKYDMEITLQSDKSIDFKPLPKRWTVERSFAWLESYPKTAYSQR